MKKFLKTPPQWLFDSHARWRLAALGIAIVLLIGGVIMAVFNEGDYQSQKKREIAVQAQILSASVAPALSFYNSADAQAYLNALDANPDIQAAAVYNTAGAPIAEFHRASAAPAPLRAHAEPAHFQADYLVIVTPVARDGEQLGAVYIRANTESPFRRLSRYIGIGILVVMAALVLGVLGLAQGALGQANKDLRAQAKALQEEIAQREKAEEALLQSRKLEAIGQLTGGIAHDFNNLLTVVLGGLRLLERHNDPARRASTMEAMRQAVERGAGLTRQMLAFSRRQTLKLEALDVGAHLQKMRELLERSLRADILVDIATPAELWPVTTDPAQLELAILNLAVNARDAMPKGGVLTISAENAAGANPLGANGGDFVQITVRDTGMGIPPELLDRVFEPYFTTKQIGQGTGLGLSQVYGFVSQSGGAVTVQSVVNEGTRVILLLPRSLTAPKPVEAPAPRANPEQAPHAEILVVEDDDRVAEFVCEMLAQMGHHPYRVANASSALGALAEERAYDVVFSDIIMPGGMNGVELAHEIRKLKPSLPIVLTTGYSGAATKTGEFPVLRKPYQFEDLEQTITAVLTGRPPAPAEIF